MCTLNGEDYTPAAGETIADLVDKLGHSGGPGIAVSQDRSVVPRSKWGETPVAGEIDIVTAVQGG
ncbi:sulfur carrier protein ThiS [Corynebacterium heidelbergense]|uniref:Thiamine biosynthesis protein ThiS n=2 Tax=Corynebacterium heidelbergense TaxID=2055947 RepID=A0A364VAY0_9CORY|nr:thiamine biosynthesis protein ThiS [Corynebacterium heidelbergense]RAV33799.1 thiamine biosynthesis protein ThiS [Corynebacterium heidelbergense]WCZ36800.1 sulfur carrier protein ThiS [Corynebacterium heidelbergense]